MMRIYSAVPAMLLVAGAAACGDSNNPTSGFVVSGTIQNNTGAPLPDNTRVLIAWGVSSGTPDYSYVFGEGTLDAAAGTFRIQLDQPPPAQALNTGQLGVGLVFATTNQTIGTGVLGENLTEDNVIGAAGRYGVIYIGSDASAEVRDWAAGFESGYNVGVGVDVVDDFDRFEPATPSSVILIIDDLANIDFVNWT
jgi:hypothetical protein